MNKRECSDCRENEKTFRSNINYKCQNDYCENYIKPTVIKRVVFQDDPIIKNSMTILDELYDRRIEIIELKRIISRLTYENAQLRKLGGNTL